MALNVPSRTTSSSSSKRNSARLDVLGMLLNERPTKEKESASNSSNSPHDSLSPVDESDRDEFDGRGRSSRRGVEIHREPSRDGKRQLTSIYEAGTQKDQIHVSFHEPDFLSSAASSSAHVNTCSPRCLLNRNHRPSDLVVIRSNGLTTIPVSELKQRICDGRTEHYDTKAQVPRPKLHRRLPKTPIREIQQAMGNTHSTSSSPTPDNSSNRSHSKRNPVRVLRKSSINLLNRIESKTPLPPAVTGTVIQVHQQVSPPPLPAVPDGLKYENDESPVDPFMDGSHRSSRSPDADAASPVTVTEENAMQPLSASTTIRESRAETRTESRRESRMEEGLESSEEGVPAMLPPASRPTSQACARPLRVSPLPPSASKRDSALSPTIPAPSPLPEDSPHKYGLKDRMETPELTEPEDVNVAKARRRSSGIEIFNEAKSLQSASSFLNGLSTSRRRAESAQRSTEASAWTLASYSTGKRPPSSARLSRPSSTTPFPAPSGAQNFNADRRRSGHNFKPSGFAYSRPLGPVQLKCYKSHSKLLLSRNRIAPVECGVCHIDDEKEHYSCSWCALRMCRYCREGFAERGVQALRERIRGAELGGSGSEDSLELMRGRTQYG